MEGLMEVLGIILAAIAIPIGALIGAFLVGILKQLVGKLDSERKEHIAWTLIEAARSKFGNKGKQFMIDWAERQFADRFPKLNNAVVSEFVNSMWQVIEDELPKVESSPKKSLK